MARLLRQGVGVWLLLACACHEPPLPHHDGGRAVPDCGTQPDAALCDEASQENVLFSWAEQVCSLMLSCCSQPERTRVAGALFTPQGLSLLLLAEPTLFEDATACRRAVVRSLFTRFQPNLEAVDDQRQWFDRDTARQCLSWLHAGAEYCAPGLVLFDEAHQPASCGHLFKPSVAAGARCFSDGDCVDAPDGGRSVCELSGGLLDDGGVRVSVSGECRPLAPVGGPCRLNSSVCQAGAFCSVDSRCEAKATLGSVCVGAPCVDSAYCDTTRAPAPLCVARRPLSSPCAESIQCGPELSCDPRFHLCVPTTNLNPLDVEFDFCLGDQTNGVARALPFVPKDGGLD